MNQHHLDNAIYNKQYVKIINHKDSFSDTKYYPEPVEILYNNGQTEWVDTNELLFPLNLKTA
jgi:hypothetical protein